MAVRLEGLTLLADDVQRLADFYREVIGFQTVVSEPHYVEFVNDGIRLAICSKALMADNTDDHPTFKERRHGQAFELNFECESPDEVHRTYQEWVSRGAVGISEPSVMSWGHTTGFWADPEGNIHSIFAVNPQS